CPATRLKMLSGCRALRVMQYEYESETAHFTGHNYAIIKIISSN
ncbi:MAG: hypothetical protein AVDCRST_MAG56-7178, partial [uncultured Cytophagales bacterium]